MKHIVYLTYNIKNGYIYVGKHKTEDENVFDGYIGCGVNIFKSSTYEKPKTAFQFAVRKYGVKAFKRITLAEFDTAEEAFQLEAIIVNKEFIKRRDVYNMVVGGCTPIDMSIEIHQYTLSGSYIKTWESAQQAAEYFNTNNNVIRNAVNYKTTSYGYLWSEDYCTQLDLSQYTVTPAPEKIYKFDENNNLVAEFDSVEDAARKEKSHGKSIYYAVIGRTKSKGYYYSHSKDFKIDANVYNKITDVYLYNLDGTFFKEFKSPIECAKYFGTNHSSAVYRAIRTGRLYKGYQISKVKYDSMKSMENPSERKKVAQYDLDGNLIKVWNSVMEARKAVSNNVQKCLKGHQDSTKGFRFKYYKE